MKRYELDQNWVGASMEPHPDGEWVRADDAEAEVAKLRAVVDALPRCNIHPERAAAGLSWDRETYYCDECGAGIDLPYAAALRELEP